MSAGMELVSSLLTSKDGVTDFAGLDVEEEFFVAQELPLYLFIKQHVRKYGAIPSLESLDAEFGDLVLPETSEPPQFYADQMKERYIFRMLSKGMMTAKEYMSGAEFNPIRSLEILKNTVVDLMFRNKKHQIMDFRNAYDVVYAEYIKKLKGFDEYGLRLGWPTFDHMSQGLFGGDVVSVVGRPAMGKTFKMLYMSHHAWWNQQKPTMVVSMEMKPIILSQRLTAMHTHKSLTRLKAAEYDTYTKDLVFNELKGLDVYTAPFWLVDGGMTATVEQIWSLAQQLKPEVIFIDGAYLVKHENKRLDRYTRVTETAEGIKHMLATDLDVPVVASYQFNREAAKKMKKDAGEVGLEDIGYSDAIGQVSSVVLGLLQEESIETQKKRLVSILKGRSGEVGEFSVAWDFTNMDFMEIIEEKPEELQFT